MPRFNREKAKAGGMTDAQIDAYLASAQAKADSAVIGQPAQGTAESRIGAPVRSDFYDYVDPGGIGVGAGGVAESPGFSRMSDEQQGDVQRKALMGYASLAATEVGGGLAGRALAPLGGSLIRGGGKISSKVAGAPGVRNLPFANRIASIGEDLTGFGRAGARIEPAGAGIGTAAPPAPAGSFQGTTGPAPGVFRGTADIAAAPEAAPAARTLADIKPLRANASRETRIAHQIELEQVMAREKLPEPAKKRLLQAMGHEAPKGSTASRIAGKIEPGPSGPKASKPAVGTAESRIPAKPRHDVKYYSGSRGHDIDIESMNQVHLEQAYRKLAATHPKPGSLASKQMDAILAESKHRLQDTGIHIGHASAAK